VGRIPKELSQLKVLNKMDFSGNPNLWPCNCTVGDEECENERMHGAHIPKRDGKQLLHWFQPFNPSDPHNPEKWGNCIYCQRTCTSDRVRFDCGRALYIYGPRFSKYQCP
jgi:hypothetical protein